jgi:hypothetical protein
MRHRRRRGPWQVAAAAGFLLLNSSINIRFYRLGRRPPRSGLGQFLARKVDQCQG